MKNFNLLLTLRPMVVTKVLENRLLQRASEWPPNILLIITDQQHAEIMSCAGNKFLNTPAIDSLARDGIRFANA